MPVDGTYKRSNITSDEARDLLKNSQIKSYVAYKEVIDVIEFLTGVRIELDSDKSLTKFVENKCVILVCKLKFRVRAENKGVVRHTDPNEYEFLKIQYER